jgi:hypothetical protein
MSCVLCHLNLCLVFLYLCILDSFFNPWSKLIHYQTLLVHAKQVIIETNPKSTHVSFAICQICLLSHDTMISLNIEAISSIHLYYCVSLEQYCFHDLSTQQYTILALIWTLCGISWSLPSCWTYIHFSFHNPQVYAINTISYSTLSKLIRSLVMLSFNSPKPTKGLDALIISPFLVSGDNTIKAYKRLINDEILNPMI